MKKRTVRCLWFKIKAIALILLVFSTYSFGQLTPSMEGVYTGIGENVLGQAAVRLIYAAAVHFYFFTPLVECTENLPSLLEMNPELIVEENGDYVGNPPIERITNLFIKISIPFYVLAALVTGIYLLFFSGSPLGRARAKATLIKLVISIGVIMLTIPIMQLFLDISSQLTGSILDLTDLSPGIEVLKHGISSIETLYTTTVFFNYWNSLYLMLFSAIMFSSLYMLIAVRFFMILYFTAFFPIAILLYAFYFTRKIGAQMFRTALAFIFIQPIMALMLVAISVAAYSMPLMTDKTLSLCFGLAAFLALVISPLVIVKVMDWLAMLMVILTTIEFPGLHGVIGMIDELQVEGPKDEEVTPPPPIRYR